MLRVKSDKSRQISEKPKRLLCARSENWIFPEVLIKRSAPSGDENVSLTFRFPDSENESLATHACLTDASLTDASIFYADNLSLTCVLYRLILWCGVSWKMEPVEDSLSAKKCLTGIAGTVQWRCTRSYQSLITKHFPTVSLMYWLLQHFY